MWSVIVGIIERQWTERRKPRRKFARAVLRLYEALEECHERYEQYRANPGHRQLRQWSKSVDSLIAVISNQEHVIKIFQADLWAVLSFYCWDEFFGSHYPNWPEQTERDTDRMLSDDTVRLTNHLKENLAALELVCAADNHASFDIARVEVDRYEALDEVRQRALAEYAGYLSKNKILDREILKKYVLPLAQLPQDDFSSALERLRLWMKAEFKPEELLP